MIQQLTRKKTTKHPWSSQPQAHEWRLYDVRLQKKDQFSSSTFLRRRGLKAGLRQVRQPFFAYLHLLQPKVLSPSVGSGSPECFEGLFLGGFVSFDSLTFPFRDFWAFWGAPLALAFALAFGLRTPLALVVAEGGRPFLPFLSLAIVFLKDACCSGVTKSSFFSLSFDVSSGWWWFGWSSNCGICENLKYKLGRWNIKSRCLIFVQKNR